ncbi:hypothetical protein MMC31_004505, partial [Peltigera leucophlebia]|nr:hypothetical protein [Peltigera leucophlebia]
MDSGTIIAVVATGTTILSHLSKYVKDVNDARVDIERLLKQIEDIRSLLLRVEEVAKSPGLAELPALDMALTAIKKTFSDIQELVEKVKPKKSERLMNKIGVQALKWPFSKEQMAFHIKRLESEKASLILALQTDSTTVIIDIDKRVTGITQNQDLAEQDRHLAKLGYADGAAFNSHYRVNEPKCVPNTRVDLLRKLQEWNVDSGKHIFWLSGMAGMGKSTIARTVAYEFSEARHLGASFFFSRGGGDLGNAQKFVTTIALQLARSFSSIKLHISDAIKRNESITCQGGLRNQWNELILGPLSQLASHHNFRVTLVVDALDECAHEQDVAIILQLFAEAKDLSTVDFKILVTSRPETPIRLGFRDMPEILHQDLALQNIPRLIVEKDITVYLRHELLTIRKERQLSSQWPGEEKIKQLVEKSDCIFIFISTACLFIRDINWQPDDQLSVILQDDMMEDSPTAKLDSMYTQVLTQSVFKQKQEMQRARLSARFKQVIGSIVVLFNVLPAQELATLLSVSPDEIASALSPLHSVLDIPKDVLHPIRLLHPSFRDFLLDEKRCTDVNIRIEADEIHENSTRNCLRLLSDNLKRDICGLKFPGTEVKDIQNAKIESCLSQALQYACHYWAAHLEKISHDRLVDTGLFHEGGPIHNFFTKDFLHWLEALSLTRRIPEGVLMIIKLESLLEFIQHDRSFTLDQIVYDAKRFILSNRFIIEKAPLQVYASALIFCPRKSIIRNRYISEFPTWMEARPWVEDNWSLTLQTLEGHILAVRVVIFSPNGRQLASASNDGTVRLWDAKTGASLQMLEHTGEVRSLTFSLDSRQLVSASSNGTVRLWDAKTGASLQTLEGHTHTVNAAKISPDGRQLASASRDKTVRLWDAETGACLAVLEGHTGEVFSVTFSPESRQIASASGDGTIRLWDAKTGAPMHTLEGHTDVVSEAKISPDGQQLASASNDKTVRLWDAKTGACLQVLEGHPKVVKSLTFSPDGRQLASASDTTVQLWDAKTGAFLQILEGHTGMVSSVTFSPDGQQLASASFDNTVRLWDAKTGAILEMLRGHTDWVRLVMFSPDGGQIASVSDDGTVRLWDVTTNRVDSVKFSPDGSQLTDDDTFRLRDAKTGALLQTLTGDTDPLTSASISPDGQQFTSASLDNTDRLWDATIGASLQTLNGHTGSVASVIFSSDGRQLASASHDKTVRLWDATTGACLQVLQGHTSYVNRVAFSPNGQQLASASDDGTIRLWGAETGASLQTLEGHTEVVKSAEFSPNGRQLASISSDNTVRLWDPTTGACLRVLEKHIRQVNSVAFSSDGQQLASTSDDNTVRLWDAKTGANLQTLNGHMDWVVSVAFSPDGQTLVSSSYDDTIRVWDRNNGKCLQIFKYDRDNIYASFPLGELWIEAPTGEIKLTAATSDFIQISPPFRKGWSIKGDWLRWNSLNIMWFPAEFRDQVAVKHQNRFAVADSSHRVRFLELSSEFNIPHEATTTRSITGIVLKRSLLIIQQEGTWKEPRQIRALADDLGTAEANPWEINIK